MGYWRNGVIKLKRSKKANEWVRWWFIDGTFVNAGSLVLCILPEPNIVYYLFIFCLEFPAAEISWLLFWRRISWFPVHFLLQQLDLSWLLVSPLPAASSLRSLCGYLGSQLGKIWWCGNFYGHRQQGRTFSCWNMTGTQAARRHRSFVSNRGKETTH